MGRGSSGSEGGGRMVSFIVKFSDGRCVPLEMEDRSTVSDMKRRVARVAEVDPERVGAITVRGKELNDPDAELRECGIGMESVVKAAITAKTVTVHVSMSTGGRKSSRGSTQDIAIESPDEYTVATLINRISEAFGVGDATIDLWLDHGRRRLTAADDGHRTIIQAEIVDGDRIDARASSGDGGGSSSSANYIALMVKMPSGETVAVERVDPEGTVSGAIERLRDSVAGIQPTFEITLSYRGVKLDPQQSLGSYGVQNECVLNAAMRDTSLIFETDPVTFWGFIWAIVVAVARPIWRVVRRVAEVIEVPMRTVLRPVRSVLRFVWRVISGVSRFLYNRIISPVCNYTSRSIEWVDETVLSPVGRCIAQICRATSRAIGTAYDRSVSPVLRFIGRTSTFAWNSVVVPLCTTTSAVSRGAARLLRDRIVYPTCNIARAAWNRTVHPIRSFVVFSWNSAIVPSFRGVRWLCRSLLANVMQPGLRIAGRAWNMIIQHIERERERERERRERRDSAASALFRKINRALSWLWREAFVPALDAFWRMLVWVWGEALAPVLRVLGRACAAFSRRVIAPCITFVGRVVARVVRFLWVALGIRRLVNWWQWRGFSIGWYSLDVQPHVRFVGAALGELPLFVMRDGTQYSVRLRNDFHNDTMCNLSIDGNRVASLLLRRNSVYVVERPVDSAGRFTFRISEAARAAAAGAPHGTVVADPSNAAIGIIQAEMVPRLIAAPRLMKRGPPSSSARKGKAPFSAKDMSSSCKQQEDSSISQEPEEEHERDEDGAAGALVAGRTSLEGHSDQSFRHTRFIGDTTRAVTLTVKLVGDIH